MNSPIRHPHVEIDPAVCGGRAHVRGTRVPVHRLWAWHLAGVPVATMMTRYPNMPAGALLDALSFAYDNPRVIDADAKAEQTLFEAIRFSRRC